MLRLHLWPVFALLILSKTLLAQDIQTVDQQLIWVGAKAKLQLENNWDLGLKYEERRFVFPDRSQQRVIPDISVAKKFNSRWNANAGLWVFTIFQPGDPDSGIQTKLHEWRPYLTFTRSFVTKGSGFSLSLKSELRLFKQPASENHFDLDFGSKQIRERFKVSYQQKIGELFKLVVAEEVHLTVAGNQKFQSFNQNRLTADLYTKISPSLELKTGYLHWFQPTGAEATYFSRNIAVLGLTYSFSL